MATRSWPGLGPVFAYEWLTASRRWQGYALRSLLVLLLLLGLSGVWVGHHDGTGELSVRQLAEIGRGFYAVTTLILLGLVGLAATGGGGRGDLPGQGPGKSDPVVLDRPDRRRDRAGQAGGAAGAGARPDRLRRPGAGAGDALRRR